MKFYLCPKCGNVLNNSNANCCGENLQELVPNTKEAAIEKHIPFCEINDNEVLVQVGEILHPMSQDHYITFIALVNGEEITKVELLPDSMPTAKFKYIPNSEIYAYCNNHGLWSKKID